MWKEVILMFAISMATANAMLLHQYITRCCDDGALYLNSNNNCSGVSASSSGIISFGLQEEEDIEDCLITMRSCCHKELQRRLCVDGIQHRSKVGSCDRIAVDTCSGSPEKTCCDCCELGLRAHMEEAPCDGLDFGIECDYSFRECCRRAGEVNERDECSIAKVNGLTLCTSKCVNLIGSYVCECPVGYILSTSDNMTCVRAPTSTSVACMFADCEYGCRPVGTNSHECYCDQGYDLDSDRSTCIDFNECELVGDICPRDQTCTNTLGSYVCHAATCSTGMSFNPESSRCEGIRHHSTTE